MQILLNHYPQIALTLFLGIFITLLGLERLIAFKLSDKNVQHVFHNVLLSIFNIVAIKIILPINLVIVALFAEEKSFGLFNCIMLPSWAEIFISLLLFDLIIYWQHRVMHDIPILWKLHGVHHSDQLIDVSTGVRFHFLEILLSFTIKMITIIILGISPITVIIFEILLSSFSLFIHGNLLLPKKINWYLKKIIITPETHRIHHTILDENLQDQTLTENNKSIHNSQIKEQKNRQRYISYNFGTSLKLWDILFKSYKKAYTQKNKQEFGRIENGRAVLSTSISSMLKEPFQKNTK